MTSTMPWDNGCERRAGIGDGLWGTSRLTPRENSRRLSWAHTSGGSGLVDRYLAAIQMMRKQPGVDEVRDSDRAVISSLLQSVRSPNPK